MNQDNKLIEKIQLAHETLFPGYLGLQLTTASKEKVIGTLEVKKHLCTVGNIIHGGAIMSFADTLGAVGAYLNLPPEASTATIESKTNLVRRSGKLGDI